MTRPVPRINVRQPVFSNTEVEIILGRLNEAAKLGFLAPRKEDNSYLLASFKGVERMGISPKWNVKIYDYNVKKMGHSIVCIDLDVLDRLLARDYASFAPPDRLLLSIDDAGWGFPLGGVMTGVANDRAVATAVVPIAYFRHDTDDGFASKLYLKSYANLALDLLAIFGAAPRTHRIEICSGHINQHLRELLRRQAYDVRVVEIRGLLQDRLEQLFRAYIEELTGQDIYYDPKDMDKRNIPRAYAKCLEFGETHCPELIKSGWKAIQG